MSLNKASCFTETKIYVKRDPKACSTHSYHLNYSAIYSQWEIILLGNHHKTTKTIKNPNENKNRSNPFHKFIH